MWTYGPNVAILLTYGSHDARHIDFCGLMVVNKTPRFWGVTKSLNPNLTQLFGWGKEKENRERKERRKRKEESFRERSSTLSLDFPVINQANSYETRSKVGPHCKSYARVSVLGSFDKLREVGVFSYLFYYLAKSHFNG